MKIIKYIIIITTIITIANCDIFEEIHNLFDPKKPYTCENGTPKNSETRDDNTELCESCNNGYHIDGIKCAINTYTCEFGTPKQQGTPGAKNQEEYCATCNNKYKLIKDTCVQTCETNNDCKTKYCDETNNLCTNGQAGQTCANNTNCQNEICENNTCQCIEGKYLNENNTCADNTYTCNNGKEHKPGTPGKNNLEEYCESCKEGHYPEDNKCLPNIYECPNGTPVKEGIYKKGYTHQDELCSKCENGYWIVEDCENAEWTNTEETCEENINTCAENIYTCPNGDPIPAGTPNADTSAGHNEPYCAICDPTYIITQEKQCIERPFP